MLAAYSSAAPYGRIRLTSADHYLLRALIALADCGRFHQIVTEALASAAATVSRAVTRKDSCTVRSLCHVDSVGAPGVHDRIGKAASGG